MRRTASRHLPACRPRQAGEGCRRRGTDVISTRRGRGVVRWIGPGNGHALSAVYGIATDRRPTRARNSTQPRISDVGAVCIGDKEIDTEVSTGGTGDLEKADFQHDLLWPATFMALTTTPPLETLPVAIAMARSAATASVAVPLNTTWPSVAETRMPRVPVLD